MLPCWQSDSAGRSDSPSWRLKHCERCDTFWNRDLNAALNIRSIWIHQRQNDLDTCCEAIEKWLPFHNVSLNRPNDQVLVTIAKRYSQQLQAVLSTLSDFIRRFNEEGEKLPDG
jgi:hypothetical protein